MSWVGLSRRPIFLVFFFLWLKLGGIALPSAGLKTLSMTDNDVIDFLLWLLWVFC